MLAPLDPWSGIAEFEQLWDWAYRFEAYTPARSANSATMRCRCCGATGDRLGECVRQRGSVELDAGYVTGRAPRDRAFKQALEAEVERLRLFGTPSRT